MSINLITRSFQISTRPQIINSVKCFSRSKCSTHILGYNSYNTNNENQRLLFRNTNNNSSGLVSHVSTTAVTTENTGLLKKLMKKVGWVENSKSRLRVLSTYLYESVADQINYLEFFDKFELPDTFNSWFLVTELHVWMLMLRVMAEGPDNGQDGRFLRNSLVEIMWTDVNTRAKKLGADNPSAIRQHIYLLSQQFQAALITYDEGIMSDDKVLASALWRRFFSRKCDDYRKLELLVEYVRKQVHHLDSLPKDEFLKKPEIRWVPLGKIED